MGATPPCGDCGGVTELSALPGFMACSRCGKVSRRPAQEFSGPVLESDEPAVATDWTLRGVEIPDSTEVVSGWRAWRVRGGKERPRLHSVTYQNEYWKPREVVEATCLKGIPTRRRGTMTAHEVPHGPCTCGLYAAKTRRQLGSLGYQKYDAEQFRVVGEVGLWGKVIEGSQGWRAQRGYPRTLYVPWEAWEIGKKLRDDYGVDVQLDNHLRDVAQGKE